MKLVSPITLRKRGVLGMNSRNINYVGRCNPRELYPLVDNKLKTKQAAMEHGMAVPKLFGVLSIQRDVKRLAEILGDLGEFVIKPAQGSGGKGILVIEGRSGDSFTKSSGATLDLGELEYHASNILSGVYSLGGRPDTAMIEALINFDEQLARYSYEGVPDIRVIVYRGIPVMAMLRCATHASDGKANLHQGAVGVGLDMGTGFSLYAVQNGERIASHPDTGQAFDALYIPHWRKVLELAAGCHEMTGLGYFGADIVLDRNHGPVILELNARPGLAIQVANQAGLQQRLDLADQRVDRRSSAAERAQLARELFRA
jgi:alpha-L-glutamate ligase-like protein